MKLHLNGLFVGMVTVWAVLFTTSCKEHETREALNPNIVLIMADDLGFGDLGCYGATKIQTPAIDRLAESGVRFTDAHASGAVCQPSRYGLMTGRYFWRSPKAMKAFEDRDLNGYMPGMLEDSLFTLPEMLRENGYETAMIGKWHLGADWPLKSGEKPLEDGSNVDHSRPFTGGPVDHGFNYYYGIIASHGMPPYAFIHNNKTDGIPRKKREILHPNVREGLMVDSWKDEELGSVLTQKAVRFIQEQSRSDRPFFLYLALSAPHTPYTPPGFIKGKSRCGERGDMVMEVDWTVEKVIGKLREQGIENETLIIFSSDNGGIVDGVPGWAVDPVKHEILDYGHKPNGYLRGEKGDSWEGGHRVPLIVSWPDRINTPYTSGELVCLTDIYPTLSEVVNNQLPMNGCDDHQNFSESLFSVKDSVMNGQRILVHHAYRDTVFALRTMKWKYIKSPVSGGFMEPPTLPEQAKDAVQLYDMEQDPVEQQNLSKWYPEIVETMDSLLISEIK